MKSGVVLRTYNYIGDVETSKQAEHIKITSETKINEIIDEAKIDINKKILDSSALLDEKLRRIDSESDTLNKNYNDELTKLKDAYERELLTMQNNYENIIKNQEDTFNNYINSLELEVKDILIDLFKKFFFKEYENTSNLDSIIQECLSQLDENKNIKISMQKNLFDKFKLEQQQTIEQLTDNDIKFSYHNKNEIILEFKTECDCIEVNFNKQMESLKETLIQS